MERRPSGLSHVSDRTDPSSQAQIMADDIFFMRLGSLFGPLTKTNETDRHPTEQ